MSWSLRESGNEVRLQARSNHIQKCVPLGGWLLPAANFRWSDVLKAGAYGWETRILADVNERMAAIHEAQGRPEEAARLKARAAAETADYQRESRRSRAHLLAFYDRVVALFRERHPHVETGRFRADMRVLVDNQGPVTLFIDTAST